MKILYGVTGHGYGHAMRALVTVDHLRSRGHQVKLVASGGALPLLRTRFDDVVAIDGLSLRYVRGGVARTRSLANCLRTGPAALRGNLRRYVEEVAGFGPDLCVSDFDSFVHLVGRLHGLFTVSLDHQHLLSRCTLGSVPRDVRLAGALVTAKMRGCDHYVVSSFYRPPVRPGLRPTTTLVGPLLRPEVLERAPSCGAHLLVYQTSHGHRRLLASLERLRNHRIIVYGAGRQGRAGNVEYRAPHASRFVDDLASCRALISHGGHTAISEALWFGKPVVSVPLRGQGEQIMNALALERQGQGVCVRTPTPAVLATALERALDVEPSRVRAGNAAAFDALDRITAGHAEQAA